MDRESSDGKKGTATACYLVILSQVIVLIIQVVMLLLGDSSIDVLVSGIVTAVLTAIWNYYLACVCKRL